MNKAYKNPTNHASLGYIKKFNKKITTNKRVVHIHHTIKEINHFYFLFQG